MSPQNEPRGPADAASEIAAHDASPGSPAVPELPEAECEQVIDHIEDFLSSGRTAADEQALRASVSETSSDLADVSIEHLIVAMMKRSCCERAPETLRVRIRAQMQVWRIE